VVWLLILALGCTLLPFVLSLIALRHLSAYASSLAVNLEPLYAIALAVVFLGEQQEVSASFYVGAALIVTVVLIYPWWSRKRAEPAQ
jgi:threonine/homoserine efflux transporter RhtA